MLPTGLLNCTSSVSIDCFHISYFFYKIVEVQICKMQPIYPVILRYHPATGRFYFILIVCVDIMILPLLSVLRLTKLPIEIDEIGLYITK